MLATDLPPFSPARLLERVFPEVRQRYRARDCILYALGIGFGSDPLDRSELPFVFEEPVLRVVPSMAVALATPGFWAREADTGIDWRQMLHGEEEFVLHRPLPAEATVAAQTRITRVIDKGPSTGALIYSERTIRDTDSGAELATVRTTRFARGNGGCGGDLGPQPVPHSVPSRRPDAVIDHTTEPRSALLYRLSGDPNPLHADPVVARAAGFDRPILHGLCTLGVAVRAVLRAYCANDPNRLHRVKVRFSRPVFPGDTIRTQLWRDGHVVSFRARVLERDTVALDCGRADLG
ncbi:MAG: MaoC/PaaZ C-terminal domain-containing protein [Myxococcota bacterium]